MGKKSKIVISDTYRIDLPKEIVKAQNKYRKVCEKYLDDLPYLEANLVIHTVLSGLFTFYTVTRWMQNAEEKE